MDDNKYFITCCFVRPLYEFRPILEAQISCKLLITSTLLVVVLFFLISNYECRPILEAQISCKLLDGCERWTAVHFQGDKKFKYRRKITLSGFHFHLLRRKHE